MAEILYSCYLSQLEQYMKEIIDERDSSGLHSDPKWFMTYHGKKKSVWLIKITKHSDERKATPFLPGNSIQQTFYCGEDGSTKPLFFEFRDYDFTLNGLDVCCSLADYGVCIVGELIQDSLSNTIFLAEDIISPDLFGSSLLQRYDLLHFILDKVIETVMNPFIVQVKVLYPYEGPVLDYFFKTVLIQYNVDLDGIMLVNELGWQQHSSCQIIACRNRATLNMEDLQRFLRQVPRITVVEHVMDFYDRAETNILHGTQKKFHTKRDSENPDIYLLYESADFIGSYHYASIPSYSASLYMNEQPSEFVMEYFYHEYQQKWIPLVPSHKA